ncbi:MAG: ABC transporter ATP-binding protein [Desulfomonilaceae bacterium]|nr:ABC transporter ATP-binding protein [Desulfomonilaceae bacterium]
MTDVVMRIDDLTVTFGGLTALSGLDMEIRKAEIVGLIGPNGAGKTTAFNTVTGIVKPERGTITFQGRDITGWKTPHIARTGIARTFQNIRLYDDLTVVENVMVAGHASISYSFLEALIGWGRFARDERQIRESAEYLLELMGLIDMARDKADSLPYGSQRKLEVARALALNPSLLLLDEPVAGMNPIETREFGELVVRLLDDFNLAIALIEHDMGFVMDVCHKIRVIDHGFPIAWGTPDEIRHDERVIAAYLGKE